MEYPSRVTAMGHIISAAKLFAITLALLGLPAAHAQQALTQTFQNPNDDFSISFPAGWEAMPPERLAQANLAARAQFPDAAQPLLRYGYVMTNASLLPFPPYLLIRVFEPDQLPDLKTLKAELHAELPPGAISRSECVLDTRLNALLQVYVVTRQDQPSFACSIGYFLTKRSVIKVFCYFPSSTGPQMFDQVHAIVTSVRAGEPSRLAPASQRPPTGLVLAALAIVVVVFVLSRAKPAQP